MTMKIPGVNNPGDFLFFYFLKSVLQVWKRERAINHTPIYSIEGKRPPTK